MRHRSQHIFRLEWTVSDGPPFPRRSAEDVLSRGFPRDYFRSIVIDRTASRVALVCMSDSMCAHGCIAFVKMDCGTPCIPRDVPHGSFSRVYATHVTERAHAGAGSGARRAIHPPGLRPSHVDPCLHLQ